MAKTYKISRGDLTFILSLLFILGFVAGSILVPQKTVFQNTEMQTASIDGAKIVRMGIPAVDEKGNGVLGTLITTVRPGTGQVLVNVNDVLALYDTQLSGRTAAQAASNFTKISLNNVDIIYDIRVNASVIEGPSAGASMAASIVLALENIPASDKIMMTGTINGDGTVGSIGSVIEKAQAAKEDGATIFLVPRGQGTELTSARAKTCRMYGFVEVCQVRYNYINISIGPSMNLTVEEVGNLGDILAVYKNNPPHE